MIEFYPQIHWVHVTAIILSGAWMALRGAFLLVGENWPRGPWAWATGLAIDGTVLTAAAMLLSILPADMFTNHWLTAKLICVTIYFVCGYALLLMQIARARQAMLLAIAMIAYGLSYGIARAHDPVGWLVSWNI